MARGESGRIVIEVSLELKRQLYSVLVIEGQALKDWFIETTGQHLIGQKPLNLQRPKNIKSSAGKKS